MNKISAIIFDCDGVMFDSRQANINYYNHILSHFELSLMTEDEVAFVHMRTADESIRHIFRNTPLVEQALAYKKKMDYTPFIKDMIMEPGLKELLEYLKPDFGLAVATNRSDTIGRVLEWNGLAPYFDMVVSSLDVKNPKPHPEALLKILKFFKIPPDQAVYVGDSSVDYETAMASGVIFIAYKNRGLDTAFHVDHLMDILEKVGGE
ncbi:MAG: HAD-IA family hydrolase [Thermodesulfobacteriota bacterium]|nr:HAD-IA family hydrolase [Thermodesulfobacteriota bacterium]